MRNHTDAISEGVRNGRLHGGRSRQYQGGTEVAVLVHRFYTMDKVNLKLHRRQVQAVRLDAERPEGRVCPMSTQRHGSTVRPP